jgi:hypothetical protein
LCVLAAAIAAGAALAEPTPLPSHPAPATVAVPPTTATPSPATSSVAGTTPQPGTVIPALTSVKVEIVKELSTKVSKEGDSFPLRLAEPITVNGTIVVPAGAEGIGEVIESKRGGMGGGAGVLILAARYVVVDGHQLRLRSMHMAQHGADNRAGVDALAIAGGLPGSFIGFLIPGGGITVAAGTVADAKTAEDFPFKTVATVAQPLAPLASATPAATTTGSKAIAKEGNSQ